jgi:hypothetical protein
MKTIFTLIAVICLSSCNILGTKVALVDDRNADGTYKATKDVLLPSTGESPIASGRIYYYSSGNVGVSGSLRNMNGQLRQLHY